MEIVCETTASSECASSTETGNGGEEGADAINDRVKLDN